MTTRHCPADYSHAQQVVAERFAAQKCQRSAVLVPQLHAAEASWGSHLSDLSPPSELAPAQEGRVAGLVPAALPVSLEGGVGRGPRIACAALVSCVTRSPAVCAGGCCRQDPLSVCCRAHKASIGRRQAVLAVQLTRTQLHGGWSLTVVDRGGLVA